SVPPHLLSHLFPYTTLFRSLEHTADIGFEAFGGSPKEVFANAARALEDLMVPLETIEPRESATILAEGRDRESLLVNWLNELLRSEEHTSELQSRVDLVCRL